MKIETISICWNVLDETEFVKSFSCSENKLHLNLMGFQLFKPFKSSDARRVK